MWNPLCTKAAANPHAEGAPPSRLLLGAGLKTCPGLGLALGLWAAALGVQAQTATAAAAGAAEAQPAPLVVTGSLAERRASDAPYAIGVLDADSLRQAGARVNLSEAMARVPGLVVSNRNNYAQDLQVSSRGFGARAGFGVRGLRLLADGIPASGPDGQGQVAHFDLAGAERVEVLRGPFSVLYGNSSGGVISLISATPRRAEVEGEMDAGSFGFRQLRGSLALPLPGGFSLRVGAGSLASTGPRPHSAAHRDLATARLGWAQGGDRVTLQASAFSQPAQDPLGLSRAQFDADPGQTTAVALTYDTRKLASQQQWGGHWVRRFEGEGAWREVQLSAYRGQRGVTQWLAIAPNTQANAQHGGGVSDFDRRYGGLDTRVLLALGPVQLQLGAALDHQADDRRGHENFTGTGAVGSPQRLGVVGALRREETNQARTADLYAQAEWPLGAAWLASAGLRSGRVALRAEDRYLANGDDSGERAWRYTNPVLGLRWLAAPGWALYASAGRGFEAPTLGELAYRADGSGGFNSALQAQTSRQLEVGSKWQSAGHDAGHDAGHEPGRSPRLNAEFTLFQARVANEIGVATNSGGRSAFQNVGRTQRQGLELAAGWAPAAAWQTRLALTWLDATYRDHFLACAGIPCSAPTVPVAAGNRVAGAQRSSAFAELAWRSATAGEWAAEWRAAGRTPVNDRNSDFAGGWATAGLRWAYRLPTAIMGTAGGTGGGAAGSHLETLVRVDNLFNRRYSGSVIVNDANGRFFEPASPRSVLLALRLVHGGW